MDFKSTIFLPKTDFPMKANLPQREKEILKFWEEEKIYERAIEMKSKKYTLHDGPPYANGKIHLGHALNKILKDITIKYHILKGEKAEFIPGWDCHGLPIEIEVEKMVGKRDPLHIRRESRKYAERFIKIQMEEFKRLGVFAIWGKKYITMSPKYTAHILEKFLELYRKGFIYVDKKPVFWCPNCITALAEAEIEYKVRKSPSIFVKFKMKDKDISALIWTTTPWTIPGNFALAFGRKMKYAIAKTNGEKIILLKKMAQRLNLEIEEEKEGEEFEGKIFIHPLIERESIGVLADFVSEEEGTGIVHIAPGHGKEDYIVGKKYNLPVESVLDKEGKAEGIRWEEYNNVITKRLEEKGAIFMKGEYEHSYPHCWRCKKPVVLRAEKQIFINLEKIKEKTIEEAEKVKWIPSWGKERMINSLKAREDWCISRQRAWGVPIPYFYCEKCGYIFDEETIKRVIDEVEKGNMDFWWETDFKIDCKCGGKTKKSEEILDVWIDSGLSFSFMKNYGFEIPMDLYIEGSDQHRGWFQSSLWLSVALEGKAPYKSVYTHGFILDEFKRKMSKSLGNVVSPEDIIREDGAEILRMWAVFEDPTEDVKVSEQILYLVKDSYRKIRNTIRFMLGALADYTPEPQEPENPLEIWIMTKFEKLKKKVIENYEKMLYNKIIRDIYSFCEKELSSLYLDIIKDVLYCDERNSKRRRSIQYTIYNILKDMIILISPILSFLAEEAYQHLPGEKKKSVFFEEIKDEKINEKIKEADKEKIIEFFDWAIKEREKVYEKIDVLRKNGEIGNSLETMVGLKIIRSIGNEEEILKEFFIVSEVFESVEFVVSKFKAPKCMRCWKHSKEIKDGLCPRCQKVLINLEMSKSSY